MAKNCQKGTSPVAKNLRKGCVYMQIISSKENEMVKHIKKLKEKKYRDLYNEFLVEGIKLVKEAVHENAKIKQIIVCEDCEKTENIPQDLKYEIAKKDCIYVTRNIFKSISEVQEPQGIIAVVEKDDIKNASIANNISDIDFGQDVIVALDNIQDPGNLGTILRTVDSCGLNQIIVSKGTADCYNPKVIRSTMGAIFRVKIIEADDLKGTLQELKKHEFKVVVSSLQAKKKIYDIDYNKKVIVIGNEANGVEKEIQDIADEKIKIYMLGKTESLNASVAAGVILYEYVRQKLEKK